LLIGHLAAWNYFQNVDTQQNKKFVTDFKAYCKRNNLPDGDKRVTDDPIEAAYFGVYVWNQAVEKTGKTDADAVRKAVYGQKFLAPGGGIRMDEGNQHMHKQFKTVWRSKGLVKPEPWSEYTNSEKGCDWISHQGPYQNKT
jgi:urea transport system substrate-binding protein